MQKLAWIGLIGASLLAAGQASDAQDMDDSRRAELVGKLFGMDRDAFDREVARRFQYPPPSPLPATVADAGTGRALDAAYFQAFPDYDRSYSSAARAEAKRMAARLALEASSLSHEQFVLRIAEIAAVADNAHTSIGENALRKNTPRLPLRTFLFADGLYVLRASTSHAELLGARVEAIDGRSIDEIYTGLARYLPGLERRRRLQLIPVLESPALLHAAGLAAEPSALTLSLRLSSGARAVRRIEAEQRGPAAPVMNTMRLLYPAAGAGPLIGVAFSPEQIPVYLRDRSRLFTIANLPHRGLYIGLTHNDDGDDEKLAPFLNEALDRASVAQPQFVVLDMRMNGGGDYTTSYDFARKLPVAARRAIIYVLTSPWTFSAAITTVAALKDAGGSRVRIVGEPVGDRLSFWSEGGTFTLPNSNIDVHYAAGRHDYAASCRDRSACFWLNELYPVQVEDLKPDIDVPLTYKKWRQGRDPAMEAILARERDPGERG